MNADGNVIKIKHDVLFEVAKLAFAGELEEQRDHLPLKLIPGPTPQYHPGYFFCLRRLSDLQLHSNRELSELSWKGMYQCL